MRQIAYMGTALLIISLLLGVAAPTHAQSKVSKIRIMANTGMSMTDFAIPASDLTSIFRFNWGAGLSYTHKSKWEYGYFYFSPMGAELSPWIFTDNSVGNYEVFFAQHLFSAGYVFRAKYRVRALLGMEQIQLTGSPDTGYTPSWGFLYGADLGWDFYRKGRVGLYASIRWVGHLERPLTFANLPAESVTVPGGNEFDFILGGLLALW